MKILSRLRELLAPPRNETYTQREYREATKRWLAHNAEARARGCPCGQPATDVQYLTGNVGAVPVEVWTCAAHCGALLWVGRTPHWPRREPCGSCDREVRCGGRQGKIGEPFDTWHCPVKPASEQKGM